MGLETADQFMLSQGDKVLVPPGNTFRFQNCSKTTEALFGWMIVLRCKLGKLKVKKRMPKVFGSYFVCILPSLVVGAGLEGDRKLYLGLQRCAS